jgi:nucleotide-binding universal stress UspA family protein
MYAQILVALDDSEPAARALTEAIRLAATLRAQLRLLHVVDNWGPWRGGELPIDPEAIDDAWAAQGRQLLAQGAAAARAAGVAVDTTLQETGGRGIAETIVATAAQWPADLIVVGAHGRRGVIQLMLGSVAEGVIERAALPVLVLPAAAPGTAAPSAPRRRDG